MITCSCCECQVVVAWLTTKDRPACENCIRYAADCPHCQRAILPYDGVTRYDGHSYCYQCARGKTMCLRCKDPVFEGVEPYCSQCLPKVVFCIDCESECSSRHYIYPNVGIFCPTCRPCSTCLAQGEDVKDGCCHSCRTTSLSSLEDGMALYPAAYEFLHDVMGLSLHQIPDLRVSLEQPDGRIRNYPKARRSPRGPAGMYSTEGWIWVRHGPAEHIAVLILVHELAHAWQIENCLPQSDGLTEGFARWMEYQCAQNLNYPEYGEALRSDPCPVYGGGLRACLHWEEAVGREKFLADIQRSVCFPLWLACHNWLGLVA